MKKFIIVFLVLMTSWLSPLLAQRMCGDSLVRAGLIARDPSWQQRLLDQKASLQGIADNFKMQQRSRSYKTTAASAVPVIFHVMITARQLALLGGEPGLLVRLNSQIDVLNEDYNRGNADSVLIPSGWKPLYGNVGIHFGLAHTTPAGFGTPGYELSILPDSIWGFNGAFSYYSDAKHASTGGLDAWDVTKYLNVWVTNFLDIPGLLGLTVSKSKTGSTGFPLNEEGVVVAYLGVGRRTSWTDTFFTSAWPGGVDHFDRGRTLTHEIGHFFEIWHTWGDDNGKCPWDVGGIDDGIADTPPEGDHKYHAFGYDVPGGTYRDSCHTDTGGHEVQPYGCATLDYMNYTDDSVMQLFTPGQAAVMAAQVAAGGENYSLTQNPALLEWSPRTAVQQLTTTYVNVSPNPTKGAIYISFDNTQDELKQVVVNNMTGQIVNVITGEPNKNFYVMNLTGMAKGIYFVRCTFASGSITRKIVLQ